MNSQTLWPLKHVCILSHKWTGSNISSFKCSCIRADGGGWRSWDLSPGFEDASGFGGLMMALTNPDLTSVTWDPTGWNHWDLCLCLFGCYDFILKISWGWDSEFLAEPTLKRKKQVTNKVSSPGIFLFVAYSHFWELHVAEPKVFSGLRKQEGFLQVYGRHLFGLCVLLAVILKPIGKWVRMWSSAQCHSACWFLYLYNLKCFKQFLFKKNESLKKRVCSNRRDCSSHKLLQSFEGGSLLDL